MRILHALPDLSGGGAERQMTYLAEAQARAGHEVGVAFLSEGPEPPPLVGVARHPLRARGNHDPRILVQLVGLLRRLRPEIAHTWIPQMDVLAGVAARLTGTPWICREPVSGAAYGGAWKPRLRQRLLRGADAIVANSLAGERYWAGIHPGGARYVIGNALPLEAIAAAEPISGSDLGLAPGRRFALYVGRLENEQKNIDHLLEALRLALADRAVDALLCGEGPHRPQAEAWIAAAKLGDRILLPGYVRGAWSVMKSAAVFVSVSYVEGQPNTVMEAMACGCPLVVSDIPMHREFVDETSALLVDPDDPQAIADAVTACLDDPEAADARVREARRRAAAFSVPTMAERYEGAYRECLERRGRGVSAPGAGA